MEPIDRAQARAQALQSLGVSPGADAQEIRTAWKRAAFTSHPDNAGGDLSAFIKAKRAYEFLNGTGDLDSFVVDDPAPEPEVTPDEPQRARPKATGRVTAFSDEVLAKCTDLLAETEGPGLKHPAVVSLDGLLAQLPGAPITDHVATRVLKKGRELTYIIDSDLVRGINRVAVPTALLENPKRPQLKVITFLFDENGAFEMDIPQATLADIGRGERQMTLRFAKQPETV